MRRNFKNHGFSHVELAAFIVFGAMIVMLVNAGRDYVFQTQIKKDVVRISEYKNLVDNFKTKYNQLPADKNKDGIWNNDENFYVFEELSKAEMTNEDFEVLNDNEQSKLYPKLTTTKQNMVPVGDFGKETNASMSKIFHGYKFPQNSFMIYFESNIAGGAIPFQKRIKHIVTKTIDKKLDDGKAATGNIRAAYDKLGVFGDYSTEELCINSKGVYKSDFDEKYFCSFVVKY